MQGNDNQIKQRRLTSSESMRKLLNMMSVCCPYQNTSMEMEFLTYKFIQLNPS